MGLLFEQWDNQKSTDWEGDLEHGFMWLKTGTTCKHEQHISVGCAPMEFSNLFKKQTFIEYSILKNIIFIHQTNSNVNR
jgi:hypothetical protein